jgi:hypothetical protein
MALELETLPAVQAAPPKSLRLGDWIAPAAVIAISAAAWAFLFRVIPPDRQNFPLADDWAYARGFLMFARGQGLHYLNWAPMPQLTQWLWALPFYWLGPPALPLVSLRISTIVISWLGLWGFYELLRQGGLSSARAAFGTALLALNPLFLLIQGSFMTDIPSLSLCLLALAFYGRAINGAKAGWLLPAIVAAVLAGINRQNSVAAPMAAAIMLWRRPALRRQLPWGAAVAIPLAVAVAVHLWFTDRQDVMHLPPRVLAPTMTLVLPFAMVLYCGLAALPMLLLNPRPNSWKAWLIAFAVLLAFVVYWLPNGKYLPRGDLFPYIDGHITPFGPYSNFTLIGDRPELLDRPLRWALTMLACLGAASLIERTIAAGREGRLWEPLTLFAFVSIPFIIISDLFDRRFLFLFPAAIYLAGLGRGQSARWWIPSLATCALWAAAALGITHDSLTWNAARWALGRRAVEQRHIHPWNIEGGFEWDASYAPLEERPAAAPADKHFLLIFSKQQFTHVTHCYALAFTQPPGTVVIDSESYSQWLLRGKFAYLLVRYPNVPLEQRRTGVADPWAASPGH